MNFAVFITFIPYIFCNIDPLKKFLSNLELSQNPHSIYILNINNSRYSNGIINSFSLPKIVLQDGLDVNYLNFPKFETINSMKYFFNREFLSLVIAENIDESIFKNEMMKDIISYSKDHIFLIITHHNHFSKRFIMRFRFENYINVIFLNIENFLSSGTFVTYKSFPFNIFSTFKFEKETVSNVNNEIINVNCNQQYPFTGCFYVDDRVIGIGRSYHTINNFVHFINGSIALVVEQGQEISMYNGLEPIDFWTKIQVATLYDYIYMYPLSTEIFVNTFEKYELIIIVPKARYIEPFLYIIKPFSLQLWILCLGYIIFTSWILFFIFHITQKGVEFWKFFDQVLRSMILQSYTNPLTGFRITVVYILAMLMGFIMANWYFALLGSFLTTFIREPQISTLSDLKKSDLKLSPGMDESINYTSGFYKIKDLVTYPPKNEAIAMITSGNRSFGHITTSSVWEHHPFRDRFVMIKDSNLEYNFVTFTFRINSLYIKRFRRYIDIIQDTGLYNYWKKEYTYESYIFFQKTLPKRKIVIIEESNIRILNINYFLYPLGFLAFGLICGFIVFIYEQLVARFKYFKSLLKIKL